MIHPKSQQTSQFFCPKFSSFSRIAGGQDLESAAESPLLTGRVLAQLAAEESYRKPPYMTAPGDLNHSPGIFSFFFFFFFFFFYICWFLRFRDGCCYLFYVLLYLFFFFPVGLPFWSPFLSAGLTGRLCIVAETAHDLKLRDGGVEGSVAREPCRHGMMFHKAAMIFMACIYIG